MTLLLLCKCFAPETCKIWSAFSKLLLPAWPDLEEKSCCFCLLLVVAPVPLAARKRFIQRMFHFCLAWPEILGTRELIKSEPC